MFLQKRLLKGLYFLNLAPPMFQMVLNTVTSKMSEDSKHVIKMLGQNKGHWMAYLDERIDRDQRYTNYGGTKKPQ